MGDIQAARGDSRTVTAIYRWHKWRGDAEPMRTYLGASVIGHPCSRYLWLLFRHGCKPTFPGRLHRLFETGDIEEGRFVRELQGIGCEVHEVDEHGQQWAVSALSGHFGGHMDGAARGIPEAPKTWHVLEFKTHNTKSFADLKVKGVADSKPQHHAQMQVYMHLTGMTRALYLAKCKDTDELYSERVRYNQPLAEGLLAKAEQIITAQVAPDRIAAQPDWWQCKFCDAHEICWAAADSTPAVPVPTISCRQCCHATPVIDQPGALWQCERHGRRLSGDDQARACPDHLFLPSFLPWTELADYGQVDGSPVILYTVHGRRIAVGNAHRCYKSHELVELPAAMVADQASMLAVAKQCFGADATAGEYAPDLREVYGDDARRVWSGHDYELTNAWYEEYGEELRQLTPARKFEASGIEVWEYEYSRAVFHYRETKTAEIRELIA